MDPSALIPDDNLIIEMHTHPFDREIIHTHPNACSSYIVRICGVKASMVPDTPYLEVFSHPDHHLSLPVGLGSSSSTGVR